VTAKIVYQTDPLGIYLCEVEADQDPLDDQNWLIPSGCVTEPPPATPANKAAYWTGSKWQLIDSLLGLTIYNTATGEPKKVERIGPLPSGYTLQVPEPFQVWKNGQWVDDIPVVLVQMHGRKYVEMNTACEATILGGFTSDALGAAYAYSSQMDDQVNLMGSVIQGLEMAYSCRDQGGIKAFRLHTAAQLRQVSNDFMSFKMKLLQKSDALKQRLDQALADKDLNALSAITWEGPHP
jgi:hypothetical protein